jgi:sugar lactone lactonase YvrE
VEAPQIAVDHRAAVGEGPVWDPVAGVLWFVDITPGMLYRHDPVAGTTDRFEVGRHLSAVIPRRRGGLVATTRDGVGFLDPPGDLEIVAPIEGEVETNRLNDAKCDPAGRLFVGSMAFDLSPGAAALYRVDPDLTWEPVVDGVTLSNGLGWSPSGDRMYYIDSPAHRVDVFEYDPATGAMSGRRPLLTFDEADGIPDGMCVDVEGCLWVAFWGGGAVRRYRPDGAPAGGVRLPVSQPSSCCFGGPDLGDLYITTAAAGLDPGEEPHAGAVFRLRPGVRGLPAVPFAG